MRFPNLTRLRVQRTGQRILDDIQATLGSLQDQIQKAPLREEIVYCSGALVAMGMSVTLPWCPILTPRRLVGAAIVVDTTIAASTVNARLIRILRYRGGVQSSVAAQLDTKATSLPAFRIVPFGFGSVDDIAFAAGDLLVLDLGQTGTGGPPVGPQILGACIHLVWDQDP